MDTIDKSINFKVKVEAEDLIELRKLSNPAKKYIKGICVYLCIFLIIVVTITFYQPSTNMPAVQTDVSQTVTDSQPFYISMIPMLILIVILTVAFYFFGKSSKRKIKKNYESNKQLQKEFEYTFSDIGMEAHSESISAKYKWDEIYKIGETKKLFVIYHSTLTATVIPKRCIADNIKILQLKELFMSKMTRKRYKVVR